VVNFTTVVCRISSWLKWYKNYKNRLRLSKVIVKNKMSRFFMVHCVYMPLLLHTAMHASDHQTFSPHSNLIFLVFWYQISWQNFDSHFRLRCKIKRNIKMHNSRYKIQAITTKHKQDMMLYQDCRYFSKRQTAHVCLQCVCTKSTSQITVQTQKQHILVFLLLFLYKPWKLKRVLLAVIWN